MPSSYTTSLRLTLPATGELAGQWGNTVNTGITELLDAAVAGTTTISTWGGAGVAYTLSNNSGTADEARRMFIVATGTPGEAKNVICPAVSKFYVFRNDTTGGFALTLKTSGGTGIAVPAGQYKFLYCDGTNVVEMFNSAGALTLSGALTVGGTATFAANPTLSAGTANQVQFLNASKVLTGSANLTFNGTTLTAADITDSSLTATRVIYAGASGNLVDSANLTFNGTTLTSTGFSGPLNGSVGATTPSTGAFTTLSASSSVTLSGGTANGVLYLNGSKVATSGSALTFDGTNLGVGSAAGSNARLFAYANDATLPTLMARQDGAGPMQVWQSAGGAEAMRLTSTGLGIGTSSPSAKLHVVGNQFRQNDATGSQGYVINTTSATTTLATLFGGSSFAIQTGGSGTNQLLLDSSGNLGLGVTPSAWSTAASRKAIQLGYIGGAAVFTNATGNTLSSFVHNAYDNGTNWLYAASSVGAARYEMTGANTGSTHAWYVSAGGTAGNAISFTQAMTLDASANLTVTPGAGSGLAATQTGLNVFGGASAGAATSPGVLTLGVNSTAVLSGEVLGRIQFYSNDASGSSTGVVGKIDCVATSTFVGDCETALTFHTNDGAAGTIAERARITSGGNLLVGTQTDSGYHRLTKSNTSDWVVAVTNESATTPWGINLVYSAAAPNNTSGAFRFADNAAERAVIRNNGGIANYQANDVNLSDRREKTNFAPAKSYLDVICGIPVQTFNYIDQSEDDPGLTLGVVAQDVQAVAPELVMESNWGTEDNPKMRLSIYQTDLQYALMKCVQELKAQNDELRARVAALEAQP